MKALTPSKVDQQMTARFFALTVSFISLALVAGWAGNIGFLKSPLPNLPQIVPNTAVTFVLCGAALFLGSVRQKSRVVKILFEACSIVVTFVGVVTLGEYVFGFDAGIDTMLMPQGDTTAPSGFLGRMAPHTSVNFVLLGLSFLALGRRRGGRTSEFLALTCIIISFGAILGHLYGAQQLYGIPNLTGMALQAAGLFLVCSFGILATNKTSGITKLLTSKSLGGVSARRLLPAVILIPTTFDWLRVLGQQYGLFDTGFGSALTNLFRVVVMCTIVSIICVKVHKSDSRRKLAEKELAEKEERYRELFDYGQSMICIHDLEGFLTTVNPAALYSIGYERDEVIGRNLLDFMPESLRSQFPAFLRQIENEGVANGTFPLVAKNGRQIVWQYQSILVSEPEKEPYVLGNAQDITKLVEAQEQLKNLSLTDELTGLYNRRGFQTLAEQQIKLERHAGTARGLSLMFADLDGLKQINDKYGHQAGSDAIIDFAKILRSALRDADLVARWGGDEFVILTIGAPGETSDMIIARIHTKLQQHNSERSAPYDLACSIGVTPVPNDDQKSFDSLIAEADEAMYQEKRRRKAARKDIEKQDFDALTVVNNLSSIDLQHGHGL